MPEPAESAIAIALLDKAIAFAAAQSPALSISLQNATGADGRPFLAPDSIPSAQWLRASVLPAPTLSIGIPFNSFNQHYGYLQVDVIQGVGGGTAPMQRLVSALAAYFPMGLLLSKDGFDVQITPFIRKQVVTQGPLMNDGPGWVKIPVSIPYLCFARPA